MTFAPDPDPGDVEVDEDEEPPGLGVMEVSVTEPELLGVRSWIIAVKCCAPCTTVASFRSDSTAPDPASPSEYTGRRFWR